MVGIAVHITHIPVPPASTNRTVGARKVLHTQARAFLAAHSTATTRAIAFTKHGAVLSKPTTLTGSTARISVHVVFIARAITRRTAFAPPATSHASIAVHGTALSVPSMQTHTATLATKVAEAATRSDSIADASAATRLVRRAHNVAIVPVPARDAGVTPTPTKLRLAHTLAIRTAYTTATTAGVRITEHVAVGAIPVRVAHRAVVACKVSRAHTSA